MDKKGKLKVLTRRNVRNSTRRPDIDPRIREEMDRELGRSIVATQFRLSDGLPGDWKIPKK